MKSPKTSSESSGVRIQLLCAISKLILRILLFDPDIHPSTCPLGEDDEDPLHEYQQILVTPHLTRLIFDDFGSPLTHLLAHLQADRPGSLILTYTH